MTSTEPARFRDTVYVIGAGFSAGLGYPLTKSLLIDVWDRLEPADQHQLQKIIEFHHPAFAIERKTTFPDIEQLLTEIAVNLDLFDASRPAEGRFSIWRSHARIFLLQLLDGSTISTTTPPEHPGYQNSSSGCSGRTRLLCLSTGTSSSINNCSLPV